MTKNSSFRQGTEEKQAAVNETLTRFRADTDDRLRQIETWLGTSKDGPGFSSRDAFQQMLIEYRTGVGIKIQACQDNLELVLGVFRFLIVKGVLPRHEIWW